MFRLIGTRGSDSLFARDGEDSLLRAGLSNDSLEDGTANDRLYGDAGNDTILAIHGGWDRGFGGRGNDFVQIANGEAWGGVDEDTLYLIGQGTAVGGKGNDSVTGGGHGGFTDLYGDEGPGVTSRTAGADQLCTDIHAAGLTRMTGGLGADLFGAGYFRDGQGGTVEIMDFKSGQDHIASPEEGGSSASTFARLDANHNGTLEWSDSLSGGAVYADGHGTMWLGLNATAASPAGSDAEDWLVVHGTNQVAAADWVLAF